MSKYFILHCDAANSAVGFVLSQTHGGELLPILYGGRVLTDAIFCFRTNIIVLYYFMCIYFVKKRQYIIIPKNNFKKLPKNTEI